MAAEMVGRMVDWTVAESVSKMAVVMAAYLVGRMVDWTVGLMAVLMVASKDG